MPARILLEAEQARLRAGQVDLGDVAGDDGLGAEPDAGEEHLHLLGRGVLRLVEDDEAVVQRVVRHQEVVGHIERVGRTDLDADGLGPTRGLDAVDEPHGPATAVRLVDAGFRAVRRKGWIAAGNRMSIGYASMAVHDCASAHESWRAPFGFARPPVGNAAERAHKEHDIVTKPRRAGRETDPTAAARLDARPAVAVEQALEQRERTSGELKRYARGTNFVLGVAASEIELPKHSRHRVRRPPAATASDTAKLVVDTAPALAQLRSDER